MFRVADIMSEVTRLLSDEQVKVVLPSDRAGLIEDIASLEESIRDIKSSYASAN